MAAAMVAVLAVCSCGAPATHPRVAVAPRKSAARSLPSTPAPVVFAEPLNVPAGSSLGYRPMEADYAVVLGPSHVASETMVDDYFGNWAGPGVLWQLDSSGAGTISRWTHAHPHGNMLLLVAGRLLYIGPVYFWPRQGSLMVPAYDLGATMSILHPERMTLP